MDEDEATRIRRRCPGTLTVYTTSVTTVSVVAKHSSSIATVAPYGGRAKVVEELNACDEKTTYPTVTLTLNPTMYHDTITKILPATPSVISDSDPPFFRPSIDESKPPFVPKLIPIPTVTPTILPTMDESSPVNMKVPKIVVPTVCAVILLVFGIFLTWFLVRMRRF
ncbi:hypothetical protein B0H66DRAFT_530602 [Apodospora peruviana]|uniref:Uncharacterized protein n=1 Tax=Apodospora peruviana TaxID=516989 RepID=A0AAE0IKT5_9PEZI|nr:hypothetical protein B0H66DRAFT_530602 [Apodospora peruviana]